jgi:putative ABC transport system permease protein
MNFVAAVRVAIGALRAHPGRSLLTSLGIVIGIGSVIAMVSAGDGVRSKLDERMATVGKNLILVRSGARTKVGAIADPAPLTRDDATALRRQLSGLLGAVAEVQLTQRIVSTPTHNAAGLLCGTTPELEGLRDWRLASGRFLRREDLSSSAAVCVLGDTVRRNLFPDDPLPIGRDVKVDTFRLRVVGVLAPKGRNPVGADQDDELFVPLTTLQRKIVGEDRINLLLTAARTDAQTDHAVEEIGRVMRQMHHVKAGSEDFDVSSVREMAELAYVVTSTLQLLVAVIASLSLLVGGIGIMNIMLVSVTERTREIGIRMAVGATPAAVLGQFLTEAVILALLGGLAGLTVGVTTAGALAWGLGWPVVISPGAVLLAFGVSAGVGVFFGFYPAWKASRLDPINALRYE